MKILPYYYERIGDKILLTNWSGSWLMLDEDKFELIRNNKLDKLDDATLFLLEEEGFLDIKKNYTKERFKNLIKGTSLHIISLTKACNLNCKYCFMSAEPLNSLNKTELSNYFMNKKTAKKVVEFIFKSPAKDITIEFTGGEPLLNFNILKYIVKYSKELLNRENVIRKEKNVPLKTLSYTITTNGLILNKEIIKFFKQNKFNVSISIDGPKEIHEFNRGLGFDKIMENIKILQENNISLSFIPVITKISIRNWKKVVDFYINELNFPIIHWKWIYPTGYSKNNWRSIGYSWKEYFNSWKKVVDYLLRLNEEGIFAKELLSSIMLKKILRKKESLWTELMNPCGAVTGQLSYNYDGKIYSCDEAKGMEELEIGNVFDDDYNSIRKKPITKEIISISSNLSYSCDQCVFNPWCGTCIVENIARENSYFSHVPSSFRHKVLYNQFKYLFKLIDEKYDLIRKWALD